MSYTYWEGSLHLSPEEALAEGTDAQMAMAAEGWRVGEIYVFEVMTDGTVAGWQATFPYVEAGGELPGKSRPWTFWLLVGGAGAGMLGGIVAAIVGSRHR